MTIEEQATGLLQSGLSADKLIRLLESTDRALKQGLTPEQIIQVFKCKAKGMSETDTVYYVTGVRYDN